MEPVDDLIDRLMKVMSEDWEVRIRVFEGGLDVSLFDPDNNEVPIRQIGTLSEKLQDCLEQSTSRDDGDGELVGA